MVLCSTVQLNNCYEETMRITTGCFKKKINSFFRKKEGHNCTIPGNKWFTEGVGNFPFPHASNTCVFYKLETPSLRRPCMCQISLFITCI